MSREIKFDFYSPPKFGLFDIESACKENRVICHPDDYKKLAESGVVEALTKGGIKVVSVDFAKKGNPIATGELAFEIFKRWRIKK